MPATFFPPLGGAMRMALIDPAKARGEEGQYVNHNGKTGELWALAEQAKLGGKEVRFYYEGLRADSGNQETVATKVIITWIPPGHVQPFHTHHRLHEMTLVQEGEIFTVDSDQLTELDLKALIGTDDLWSLGSRVGVGQMIIEGPGTRHTVLNATDRYAVMYTVQTARMGIEHFDTDWHADKPLAVAA